MIYRLSPGLVSGDFCHDAVTRELQLKLNFAGCAPVVLQLQGDVIASMAGRHGALWGYVTPQEDYQPNEAGEPASAVAAFVEGLRGNASGWITRCQPDDSDGIELSWRDERHATVGNVRFALKNPRAA